MEDDSSAKKFAKFCRSQTKQKVSIYRELIADAEENAHEPWMKKLVRGCKRFMNKNEHLTEKQIRALEIIADWDFYAWEEEFFDLHWSDLF